jgi:hypothetical protein
MLHLVALTMLLQQHGRTVSVGVLPCQQSYSTGWQQTRIECRRAAAVNAVLGVEGRPAFATHAQQRCHC